MPRKKQPPPIDIDDIIYLRSDPDRIERRVVEINVKYPPGIAKYKVALGDKFSVHYDYELIRGTAPRRTAIEGFTPKKDNVASKRHS